MYSDPLFFRLWFKRQTFVNILIRNLLQMYSDGKSFFIGNVWNTIFYFVLTEPYTRSGSLSLLKPVCFFVLFSRNNGSPVLHTLVRRYSVTHGEMIYISRTNVHDTIPLRFVGKIIILMDNEIIIEDRKNLVFFYTFVFFNLLMAVSYKHIKLKLKDDRGRKLSPSLPNWLFLRRDHNINRIYTYWYHNQYLKY